MDGDGKGNRRKGGARGQSNGRHNLDWRDDALIRARIAAGTRVWLERRPGWECQQAVNKYLKETFNVDPVSMKTIYADRHRQRELWAEEGRANLDDHLADLDHVIASGWRGFHKADAGSSSAANFLRAVTRALQLKAQLDGSFKVRVEVSTTEAEEIGAIIDAEIPDPEQRRRLAMRVLSGGIGQSAAG